MTSLTRRELFTRWLRRSDEKPAATFRPAMPDPSLLPVYLRPPGALPEAELVTVCERCHECQRACPHDVILPLGPAYREAAGTPAILPRGRPCRICEGLPCAAACPSGALRPIPLEEVRLGTAQLDPARCLSVQGETCDDCVNACPMGEIAIGWDGDRPRILEDGCTGCGHCVHACRASPPALDVRPAEI